MWVGYRPTRTVYNRNRYPKRLFQRSNPIAGCYAYRIEISKY